MTKSSTTYVRNWHCQAADVPHVSQPRVALQPGNGGTIYHVASESM